MGPLRLVSAFFLAPFATAAVVAVALFASNVDLSGRQDDGKYLPTLMGLLVPTYVIALVLSLPIYFLVSRRNWTSPRAIALAGAVPPALLWILLNFGLFRNFHPVRILFIAVFALAGAAWGLAFWWLANQSKVNRTDATRDA